MRANKSSRSNAEIATVSTAGQVFPDGAIIELIGGTASCKPDLLLWIPNKAETVAPRLEYLGRTYEAVSLPPSIHRAMRLPARCADYGSVGELFTGIADLFTRHFHFAERESKLLACFCMSTWLADRLPSAPGLAIFGPDQGAAIEVLRLLNCLCRRPLLLGEITRAGFRALPMYLLLTLLINRPGCTPEGQRLIQASNYRGLYFPGNRGSVVDLYGPKAIFWGIDGGIDNLDDGAIRIVLEPSQVPTSPLDERVQNEIASDFQPRLLMFRLKNQASVPGAQVDVAGFTSATGQLAHNLAACLPGDSELARETLLLMRPQDEDVRAQRSCDVNCVIVEILWGLVHHQKQREVKVRDLRNAVNALLLSRGEVLEFSAEEVGWRLRGLNIPRHTDSSGRHILLGRETSQHVHQLAFAWDLPCLERIREDCPECAVPKVALIR